MTTQIINPETIDPRSRASLPRWQPATWEDYVTVREEESNEVRALFFHRGSLLIEMGTEGINHARFNDLCILVFFIWFSRLGQVFDSLSGCLMEKTGQQAASPDKVLYIGEDSPQWKEGETRSIDLDRWRVPDLVGEVGDTTLAADLDEKKQLYAALGVPEYWVVDVKGKRVLAFRLQSNQKYQQCEVSEALFGLPIDLLEQTLTKLDRGNGFAAMWFAQQIADLEQ